ncbi:MAG: hypothetical protein HKM06_08480 [Spirochaetales bacterium]|nr:hypothetical protein [Spirochaetales bacterium]
MIKNRGAAALFLFTALTFPLAAQTPRLDPHVLTGVLPDGMRYFFEYY